MSVSPEHMQKVAEWREKARAGTLTQDEMREAISFLRAERTAMPASTKPSAKKKAEANVGSLLDELDNL